MFKLILCYLRRILLMKLKYAINTQNYKSQDNNDKFTYKNE